jgi:plastocyanin
MRRVPHYVAIALAGAALAAAPALAAPKVYTIAIKDMAFTTAPPVLHVGDTVEWVNNDIFRHSATAKDKSFDVDLAPQAHGRVILKKAGTISFYCRYHPGMTGTLVVSQ